MQTVSTPLIQAMLKGAELKELDQYCLLQQALIDPDVLHNDKARITVEQCANLGNIIIDRLNDEALGLFTKPQKPGSFKHLVQSSVHANSLYEAMGNAIDLLQLLEHPACATLKDSKDSIYLSATHNPDLISSPFAVEYFLGALHRFFCWLSDAPVPIANVQLHHSEQPYKEEYKHFFMGAPIQFEATGNCIEIKREHLEKPLRKSPSSLKKLLKNTPFTLLTSYSTSRDIILKTQSFIEKHTIEHQEPPSIEITSEYFNISKATYRRRLNERGTNYNELKQNIRRDLAIKLLTKQKYSVEQTAIAIGFSETSSFVRAFKTWMGCTPSFYKQ